MHNLCIKICRRTSSLRNCPCMGSKNHPSKDTKRMLKKSKILILQSNVLTLFLIVFWFPKHHTYFLPMSSLYGLKGSVIPSLSPLLAVWQDCLWLITFDRVQKVSSQLFSPKTIRNRTYSQKGIGHWRSNQSRDPGIQPETVHHTCIDRNPCNMFALYYFYPQGICKLGE